MRQDVFKIQATEDGLHLRGTILWLDSHTNGDLSFLSAVHEISKPILPQIITTEENVKILEAFRKKPNALVCQYNRPFSIGRLRMELLPSGHVLGGASLLVDTDHGPLLYAPFLQSLKISTVRQLQLHKAKILILGAYHSDPLASLPNRKKEKERLVQSVQKACEGNSWPIIVCPTIGLAQEITQALSSVGLPLAAHPAIYKVNKIYEDYGVPLGAFSAFSLKRCRQKVILFPLSNACKDQLPVLPERPIFLIKNDSTSAYTFKGSERIQSQFELSMTSDGPELLQLVQAVKPKELYFVGPYAKQYVEAVKGTYPQARALFPNDQPPLF